MNAKTDLPKPPMWDFSATSMTATVTPMRRRDAKRPPVPTVFYTTEAWQTIQYLVQACKEEVGWLGLVEEVRNGDYLITDIFIPKQSVSGVTTEIEEDAMTALAHELIEAGLDPSKLCYWGHSHVNMQVSPSGQDERQTAEYIEHCPVFIRGIYNKRGDSKVDVFHRDEATVYQCVDNMPEHDLVPYALAKELDDLIKDRLRPRVYEWKGHKPHVTTTTQPPPSLSAPRNWPNGYDWENCEVIG